MDNGDETSGDEAPLLANEEGGGGPECKALHAHMTEQDFSVLCIECEEEEATCGKDTFKRLNEEDQTKMLLGRHPTPQNGAINCAACCRQGICWKCPHERLPQVVPIQLLCQAGGTNNGDKGQVQESRGWQER